MKSGKHLKRRQTPSASPHPTRYPLEILNLPNTLDKSKESKAIQANQTELERLAKCPQYHIGRGRGWGLCLLKLSITR